MKEKINIPPLLSKAALGRQAGFPDKSNFNKLLNGGGNHSQGPENLERIRQALLTHISNVELCLIQLDKLIKK